MKNFFLILFFITVIAVGVGYYYFFVDTLSLTEITGKSSNPMVSIALNIFDFDTGLTRYDMYKFRKNAARWTEKQREISELIKKDPKKYQEESLKLSADMMEDAVVKKITKKMLGFGAEAGLEIMKAAL